MSLLSVAARSVTDWMKLGFPEEVAKRIVSGELPMDKASRLLPAAAAGLLATQSDDAEAGFVTRGGKTLLEAWHGSPHKFDKFSMDAIGTGEGAQAYGHGLYFADDIDVAKSYRPRDYDQEEELYRLYKEAEEAGDQYMMDAWERAMMHDSPIELRASAADSDYDEHSREAFTKVADYLESNLGAGSLSRVEIDVTPDSLLDWNKPLNEQSEAVRSGLMDTKYFKALRSNMETESDEFVDSVDNILSGSKYDDLVGHASNYDLGQRPEEFSKQLSDRGIKGIQFLDDSGSASNYVIFDDSLINIAERGSADPRLLAGIAAGGGGVSAATALSNKLAAAQAVRERGDIRAPNSGMLHSITMGARDLERRLEGHPAALLFPEGVVKYLEQLNREERPNRETVLWALLDMI